MEMLCNVTGAHDRPGGVWLGASPRVELTFPKLRHAVLDAVLHGGREGRKDGGRRGHACVRLPRCAGAPVNTRSHRSLCIFSFERGLLALMIKLHADDDDSSHGQLIRH